MNTPRELSRDLEAAISMLDRIADGERYMTSDLNAVADELEAWQRRIDSEPGQVGMEMVEADESVTLLELADKEVTRV